MKSPGDNRATHLPGLPSSGARLSDRRRWALAIGAAGLVAITAVVFAISSGEVTERIPAETPIASDEKKPGGSQPGTDSPPARPMRNEGTVPLRSGRPLKEMDNPEADGWQTEVLSQKAKGQLKQLGKLIQHPEKIDGAELERWVADDFSCGRLVPPTLTTIYDDSAIKVQRTVKPQAAAAHPGVNGLRVALEAIASTFTDAADVRVEIKPFRIRQDDGSFTTRQYVAISGHTKNGVIEQHSTWIARWVTGDGDSPPRLAHLAVTDFEQVTSRTGGRTLFSDCTQSVLGQNASFQQQIARGLNHWLPRIQDSQYGFLLGTPGVALGDVNGDGLDDLYLCQEEGLPNRLYVQNADGTLRDESQAAGVNWLEGSRSALLVDLDNDGDRDLAVAILGGVVLAANRGDGRFEFRTLLPTSDDAMSLSAADYDNDGRLDLYVCAYFQDAGNDADRRKSIGVAGANFVYHDANDAAPNSLFRNETTSAGKWSFRDATAQVGLDQNNRRWSLAAAWEDFDNDGDQDLYVGNDFGRNNLYRNDGGRFVDVAADAGVEDSASGMAIAWGDFDRDGRMDLYVSNMFSAAGNRIAFQQQFKPNAPQEVRSRLQRFARGNTLLRNLDKRSFGDVSEEAAVLMGRWAWGTNFVDLNNNGWQDLVVANGYITGDDSGDL